MKGIYIIYLIFPIIYCTFGSDLSVCTLLSLEQFGGMYCLVFLTFHSNAFISSLIVFLISPRLPVCKIM
jgi:hypothetical protein